MKGDNVLLLNDVEITLHDKPTEIYTEKREYEQAVSECNKWRSLIKIFVERNITFIKKTLYTVQSEYG